MNERSAAFLLLAAAIITLIGCAGMEQSRTKDLLSQAGFREIRPQTAKQKELYAAAPAYKMHQITAQGKTFYAYKDEERGTAFIGDELKFRQYQRLLMQENAAQEQARATMMQPQVAMGWYGAYSPYLWGPRYGARYGAYRYFRRPTGCVLRILGGRADARHPSPLREMDCLVDRV